MTHNRRRVIPWTRRRTLLQQEVLWRLFYGVNVAGLCHHLDEMVLQLTLEELKAVAAEAAELEVFDAAESRSETVLAYDFRVVFGQSFDEVLEVVEIVVLMLHFASFVINDVA